MKIGDEALAVVKSYRSYKIVPVTITGVMDSAKSVSVNGESEKEIKRYYQVDSDVEFSQDMIPSENIFALEDKEHAIERRNELMGIKSPAKIEDEKLTKAKKELEKIKEHGKWDSVEDIEETLINLLKDDKLVLESRKQVVDRLNSLYYDPFDVFERRLARLF